MVEVKIYLIWTKPNPYTLDFEFVHATLSKSVAAKYCARQNEAGFNTYFTVADLLTCEDVDYLEDNKEDIKKDCTCCEHTDICPNGIYEGKKEEVKPEQKQFIDYKDMFKPTTFYPPAVTAYAAPVLKTDFSSVFKDGSATIFVDCDNSTTRTGIENGTITSSTTQANGEYTVRSKT